MKQLQRGAVIECPPLMSNLTDENVVAKVEVVTESSAVYNLYYFGVFIGKVNDNNGSITYEG